MRKRDKNTIAKILLFLLLIIPGFTIAQSRKMKKASEYMEVLNYEKAIETYHKIIQRNGSPTAQIALAEAYQKNKDYKNAGEWYAKIILLPEARAVDYLNNGLLLLRAGECEKAQANFDVFLKLKPYDLRKDQLGDVCHHYEKLLQKNQNTLTIDSLSINTSMPELGPAYYQNGIVYAAVRPDENHGKASFDLYFVDFKVHDSLGIVLGEEQVFAPSLNTLSNEATPSFSQNGKTIYFTRNQKNAQKKNIYKLEILESHYLKSGVWSKPQTLSFSQKEFSFAHPALSPAGTQLFFASDMPGGFGGTDIYVSNNENGKWGQPINLGPQINTEGDELYPYFRKDGFLFFSSDGHIGLGGQDIFKTQQASDGTWSKPENCGAQINSAFDDFGISFSENLMEGFFSSNRDSGRGSDDIYYFKKTTPDEHQVIFVSNIETEKNLPDTINYWNACDSLLVASANPFYKSELMGCSEITVMHPAYLPKTFNFSALNTANLDTIRLFLTPKHSLIEGVLIDKTSSRPINGAQVSINSSCGDTQSTTTDNEGKYTFTLLQGCCYTGRIEWKKNVLPFDETYCTEKDRYKTYTIKTIYNSASFEDSPTALTKKISDVFEVSPFTEKEKEKKREEVRFTLEVYYDIGRASVRKSAIPEMRKLLKLLKDNPTISIEISSHTDAVGSDEANLKLSQRRANAIKNWLVAKGIASSRIVAIGYGESMPVNHCVDGVKCSGAELQLNRRTEFKLLTTTASTKN